MDTPVPPPVQPLAAPAAVASPAAPTHPHLNPRTVHEWVVTGSLILGLTAVFAAYLYLRRGYLDLYIINKSLGSSALAGLGIVLLIGPFSRMFHPFVAWLAYRRELGMISFLAGLAHGVISLFFLPDHFQLSRFFGRVNFPFYFALASTAILTILFALSFDRIIGEMNRRRWWKIHNWGVRLGALLAFLHLAVMKYPGWLTWWEKGGSSELVRQYLPPASLIGFLFGFYVLAVRFAEFAGNYWAKRIIRVLSVLLVVATVGLFIRGAGLSPLHKLPTTEDCAKFSASARAVRCPGMAQ